MVFFADCENEHYRPFNFIDEYCTSESAWPTCRLTEQAFHYHRLSDTEHPYGKDPYGQRGGVYEQYVDKWAMPNRRHTY